ncbi:TonB-dependent receptor family protein [Mucilaginibacter sp. RS28]|uniref:TonB-dependent receptor family protein n=1 Tax=Mucilaginibacter straminoryzae TaxID=2932774 RepID=A0A9X1WYX7_9SPHI|nr:TonB-dependent receptor [Mucilaginibacter straminoryzae]MCJ8208089.1 TonB-dependent receptor family protein [Mucilaginibacter straminoryzae]
MHHCYWGLLFSILLAYSKNTCKISGQVIDHNGHPVATGRVYIRNEQDTLSTLIVGGGFYQFDQLRPGYYQIAAESNTNLDFPSVLINLTRDTVVDIAPVRMAVLGEVKISARKTVASQMGDTLVYDADAVNADKDASTEELLRRFPGILVKDGNIIVNGQPISDILMDGRPVLGGDIDLILKNLPAEVVKKLQVFDKGSDQSLFTGLNDGRDRRTINIVTKTASSIIGKVYAGHGGDDLYAAGGTLNFKDKSSYLSALLQADDLGQGASAMDNLSTSPTGNRSEHQNGNINFSRDYGRKIKLSVGLSYTQHENNISNDLQRQYFGDSEQYMEQKTAITRTESYLVVTKLEYKPDSFNAVVLQPSLGQQWNSSTNAFAGQNSIAGLLAATTNTGSGANGKNLSLANDLLINHRFRRSGRILSASINIQSTPATGDGNSLSHNIYGQDTVDYSYLLKNKSSSLLAGLNLLYIEPIFPSLQLVLNYKPSYQQFETFKENYDNAGGTTEAFDSLLSNRYQSVSATQNLGLGLRFNNKRLFINAMLNHETSSLRGTQYFPKQFNVDRNFKTLLPFLYLAVKGWKNTSLKFTYNVISSRPGLVQLQPYVDISNPLIIRTGAPDLKQEINHDLHVQFMTTSRKGNSLNISFAGNYKPVFINNTTELLNNDTLINSVLFKRGGSISLPQNLNGYFHADLTVNYNRQINLLDGGAGLFVRAGMNVYPGIANGVEDNFQANTCAIGGQLTLNLFKHLDFVLEESLDYSRTKSKNGQTFDYRVNRLVASCNAKLGKFKLNLWLNDNVNSGSGASANRLFINASTSCYFTKNRTLECRISGMNLLDQRMNMLQTATSTYIEYTNSNVVGRYMLISAIYTFRKIKKDPI